MRVGSAEGRATAKGDLKSVSALEISISMGIFEPDEGGSSIEEEEPRGIRFRELGISATLFS